ncbi:RNA pseudouridine synthase [Thermoleophilia bacterium SCSIO 60948]|nr:RNA pseudouridine synthase [Thermoleophilia bacterium SCSIO 60948]
MSAEPELVLLDDELAVVDKPPGLVVHPAPGTHDPTLVDLLGELLGGGEDPDRPGIVHRLDRDTSGLMLVARTPGTHVALSRAIAERRVDRTYLALVDGIPRSRSGTIDAALGRDHRRADRRAVGGRGARPARTHFEVEEALDGQALLRLKLETGRTHQIRVHLSAIGHPIAGDETYGGRSRPGLERQFLHSHAIGFTHPLTRERIELVSELPPDLARVLEAARG